MFVKFYQDYMSEFVDTLNGLKINIVEEIMEEIERARIEGNHIFIIGNGGSAASASHWACDLGKGVNVGERKRIKVISPGDNLSILTALGNDLSYEDIFVEQLKNHFTSGDIVIGLSVSGSSVNVVKALKYAKSNGGHAIALIGDNNGILGKVADISLVIPSKNYGIVEDIHMFVNHVISQYLRQKIEEELKDNE